MKPVFSLSLHARYRCEDSGVCCSSGWAISIEPSRGIPLEADWRAGRIQFPLVPVPAAPLVPVPAPDLATRPSLFTRPPGLPADEYGVLPLAADGACAFHDAVHRRCHVQRQRGHDALPRACRLFPRVCLIDPRGVSVSLSHYCPTAARTLFTDAPVTIVQDPPAFPRDAEYEGLDASDAYPPLLRPGVLLDWETLSALERHLVQVLDEERHSVDAALRRADALCEHLRAWTPDGPPLLERLRSSVSLAATVDPGGAAGDQSAGDQWEASRRLTGADLLALDADVRGAIPAAILPASARPGDTLARETHRLDAARDALDARFVRPVCRYLAARLFGSWCWYLGHGLRTLMQSLRAAYAVLTVEAAADGAAVVDGDGAVDGDEAWLREAIRRADLVLLHLASRQALAARWSRAETLAEEGCRPYSHEGRWARIASTRKDVSNQE